MTGTFLYNNDLNFNKPKNKTRIIVAMSGGVDSSVVACMLHQEGFEVIGITLQLYNSNENIKKNNSCCAGIDINDAKKVAEKFGFAHYVLNYQDLFKKEVIDDFVDSYLAGETPIPCIKCNKSVKFRDLLRVAKSLNADAMATGHYVRRVNNNNIIELHKGIDEAKDQSYFLFETTQEQLKFLRFPLGNLNKKYTREKAIEYGLEVASKPDSQDICFVPNGDYSEIIKKYRPNSLKTGQIVHCKTGDVLGHHGGIINYTLGQRKGIGISSPKPLYVTKIDSINNNVFVGEEEFLYSNFFSIRDVNWLALDLISPEDLIDGKFTINASVRIRSSGENKPARIQLNFNPLYLESLQNIKSKNQREENFNLIHSTSIEMKSMTRAITPGQACVIYHDSRILGGGWIENTK